VDRFYQRRGLKTAASLNVTQLAGKNKKAARFSPGGF
jgi:hypothetical protein